MPTFRPGPSRRFSEIFGVMRAQAGLVAGQRWYGAKRGPQGSGPLLWVGGLVVVVKAGLALRLAEAVLDFRLCPPACVFVRYFA